MTTRCAGALRFAVENAPKILETERKHLGELPINAGVARFQPTRPDKATQFIESTD
jgi:hypothetical protein